MSSLLLKCGQLIRCRTFTSKNSIYNIPPTCHTFKNYPFDIRCATKQSQHRLTSTMPPKQSQDNADSKCNEKKEEDPEYVIKFKPEDIKYQIKQFYSLYGPLFLVCHIGVGLASLGFLCSLVWLNVNLGDYIPAFFTQLVGTTAAKLTGSGGKFMIAYAIHKVLLPLRLLIAISLTKSLSPKVKMLKNKIFGK